MITCKTWFAILLTSVIATGCGKAPPPEPGQPALPDEIILTNLTERVSAEEARPGKNNQSVAADFNLDGFKDLAVVRKLESNSSELAVYIRDPAPGATSGSEAPGYFRIATFQDSVMGRIVGIVSRQRGRFTDIILLMRHEDGHTSMTHYQNDGIRFRQVAEPEQTKLTPP